jgi:hypothetical protein
MYVLAIYFEVLIMHGLSITSTIHVRCCGRCSLMNLINIHMHARSKLIRIQMRILLDVLF